MGGENSMSAWVSDDLAQKDYTHFTYKGARFVGEMLYNSIMDYE
jgi:lysophospholipase L1-like esterase